MNHLSQQIEWHRLAHSRAGEAVNIRLMAYGEEFFLLTRDLFATREGGAFWSAATSRRTPEFPLIYAQASGICKLPSRFHILCNYQYRFS
jgi:hypothetical protein